MLELGEHGAWIPPVLKTVARTGDGVPSSARPSLAKHRAFLAGPEGASRRRDRTVRRIESIVQQRLLAELHGLSGSERRRWRPRRERIEARERGPVPAAQTLLATAPQERRARPCGRTASGRSPTSASRWSRSSGGGAFYDLLGLLEEHREEVESQKVLDLVPAGRRVVPSSSSSRRSPESPIAKYLEKKGPGVHHVCLEVADVAAMLARLKAGGVRLVNETPFAGAHGCLVAFVHPASTGGRPPGAVAAVSS